MRVVRTVFASFTVAVGVIATAFLLSFALGLESELAELLLGHGMSVAAVTVSIIAFPILWRYLK